MTGGRAEGVSSNIPFSAGVHEAPATYSARDVARPIAGDKDNARSNDGKEGNDAGA